MKRGLVAVGLLAAGVAACEFSVNAGSKPTTPNGTAAATPATPPAPGVIPSPRPIGASPSWRARMLGSGAAYKKIGSSGGTTSSGGTSSGGTSSGGTSSGGTTPANPAVVTADTPFGGATADADSFMGNIYVLPAETTKLPDFATLKPTGTLFAKELNVSSRKFETGFPGVDANRSEFFGIVYDGPLTVATEADYTLRLVSDDGAKVFIDDLLLIDNDGVHTAAEKKQPVHLQVGTHAIRVEYFQAAKGDAALQLFISGAAVPERTLTTKL
ncbi:MAG: hypothetical protein HOO96_01635 [Polyangiaceae bacterium]|nr:hypothetical protein [Polyangiaceae bacterium]